MVIMNKLLSLRKNFAWAFAGNMVSAFCMWLLLVVLTKLATVETVGVFGIAQAVGLPISMLLSLKLKLVQVTDAKNDFDFGHYYALKILTAGATAVVIAIVGFSFYAFSTAIVTTALGIGYAIIAFREVFLAVMQKAERMDLMAVSRMFQGFLSMIMFGVLFWISRSLALSIVGLIAARLIVLFFYDIPTSKKLFGVENRGQEACGNSTRPYWHREKLWQLLKLTAPLGLVAGLGTLFTSIPRLSLDKFIGRKEVGYFVAMSSLLVVGNMVIAALGQATMPRMAKYYAENLKAYKLLLGKLTGVCLLMGVVGVVASILFGKLILTLVFTSEYAEHSRVFIHLMIAGCVWFLFSCMNSGLTAARRFAVQTLLYALCVVACVISAFLLIPHYGMFGAAWSLLACYCTGFIGCLICVVRTVQKRQVYLEAHEIC